MSVAEGWSNKCPLSYEKLRIINIFRVVMGTSLTILLNVKSFCVVRYWKSRANLTQGRALVMWDQPEQTSTQY